MNNRLSTSISGKLHPENLVVEVTEKPADLFSRADNRGTPARGPIQGLTTVTGNNLLRIHEAFSFTYAGSSKPRELQYHALNYRQVLTSEGLTGFFNASYGHGRPGTFPLEILDYRTQSQYTEVGLTYPVIRARERNFNLTGLWFWSDDRSSFFDMPDQPPSTLDKMRGFRLRAETDWADQFAGINQLGFTVSHGIQGLGSTTNDNELASRAHGRVDFTKAELSLSRLQPLFDTFSVLLAAYGQYAFTPLLVSELCGYGGRVFGRGFDPSQFVSDTCFEWLAELRYDMPIQLKGVTQAQLYAFADHGWLHNIAPVLGTFKDVDASSIGAGLRFGWLNSITADFSATQITQGQGLVGTGAVPQDQNQGPRRNTRYFLVLSARL